MLLHEVVAASERLAATRSRKAKVAILAETLTGASADELTSTVAFLAGQPRQGRIGTGWRTLSELKVPAASEPELTIGRVDAALAELAETSGTGSGQRRTDLLGSLLGAATAQEQRFLVRLITGELRQGALEGNMLDAIAAAAEVPAEPVRRAFMLSGDLGETAGAAISGGRTALYEFRLRVGRPIRPMLASPAESLTKAVAEHGSSIVEYKLDGARIQVHRDGDEGKPRPFQQTMARFGSSREEQVRALLLRPYFFDCLHLDGVDLLDEPLRERRSVLHRLTEQHIISGEADPEDAQQVLDASIGAGHEGVMVKNLDSPYAAGRRGKAWLKVKPVHTVDLVVLAAEWGHGRRTGYLSNLHLGARDTEGGAPIMVGKTFKGLTDELLAWQTRELRDIETEHDSWTVHVRPELVVEIELDGAQTSARYPAGVAVRFARVVRYRPDKSPAEADTIDTLRAMLRA